MLSDDEITGQQQLLAAHRRTLAIYLQQQAEIGRAYSPPSLISGIAEARTNIRHIKQRLRDAGVTIADHPDDSESVDVPDPHSYPMPGTVVPQQPSSSQPRRWLIGGILGVGAVVIVALLVARFLTSPGAATPSQSFTYSFPNGTSDWGVDNEADTNKWQVIQVAAGNFVYQGTAPSDQDHDITSAPPSDDIIKDWHKARFRSAVINGLPFAWKQLTFICVSILMVTSSYKPTMRHCPRVTLP